MATKILKIGAGVVLLLVIVVGGLLAYVSNALPDVGEPPKLKVESTPEQIERGKYLANCVAVCMDCHSTRDWSLFSGPLVPGTLGKGGEEFTQTFGFPGNYVSRNITPFALAKWSDGEIFRAIACGVGQDGRAFFPVMPYPNYNKMDVEDVSAIIAYLRTLQPIESAPRASKHDFPMNFIVNTIPKPFANKTKPSADDVLAYGEYLVTVAGCAECHSQQENGQKLEGLEFAGGFKFPLPTGGVALSSNLTPDTETGLGAWTEAAFVNRFKAYADSSYKPNKIEKGSFNTVMPWTMYAGMTETDLKAIYAYLKTLKPIKNEVQKFTP